MFLKKTFYDKSNIPVTFFCNLRNGTINEIRHLYVFGYYGNANDCLELEIALKLDCAGKPLEIIKLYAGKDKRLGRGSITLKFLENELIPILNVYIDRYFPNEKVSYIYGISSDLCDDTDKIARLKFYNINGYKISNSHFYKFLEKTK